MIHVYARVSGPEQARDNAISIPEQLRKGRAVALVNGATKFDIQEWTDAGVSGTIKLSQRPSGKAMWEAMANNDMLIAAKLDRLFRSSSDALNMMEIFREKGIKVILIDMGTTPLEESATAKLFFTMLAAFAAFERESIHQRCLDGIRGKVAKGGWTGGHIAPYGYEKAGRGRNSRLEPVESEQLVIRYVMRHWSWDRAEIIRGLERAGYVDRRGKAFQGYQIERIHKFETKRRKFGRASDKERQSDVSDTSDAVADIRAVADIEAVLNG